jgi:hypothetical protein
LVIPASFAAYDSGLHLATWLPKSARARVILWEYTAEQVLNRPFSHDIYLQTWYELGAVGALLLAIAGAAVVLLIFLLPLSAQPFAAGAFAAFAIVGAFAWGMWQSWFMCGVALLPIYLRVAASSVNWGEIGPGTQSK